MKLKPYADVRKRHYKVCKHVFCEPEAWWEIFGDYERWYQDWSILGDAKAFPAREDGSPLEGAAAEVADANHDDWLRAAGRACESSRDRWEDGNNDTYVSDRGVVVIVAGGHHLVTCYRPSLPRGPVTEGLRVEAAKRQAHGKRHRRAAVRRQTSRASLDADRVPDPGTE